jgi:hypothetical protein
LSPKRRRLLLALGVALALPFAALCVGSFARPGVAGPVTNPADFRAFACGARVLARGGDPYRTEPLRQCEQAAARSFGLTMFDGLVLPAPLPPYALTLFAPLGLLPFPAASLLWFVVSIGAVSGASLALVRLGGLPLPIAVLAMLGAAYVSLPLGQLVPLVVALLCAAALAARAARFPLAAVICALTTIEPHLGLPACLALFVCAPRSRRALLACAAVAVALSLWFAGPAMCLEYVRDVLPAHARSQVGQFGVQYSLTALLFALGASGPTALYAGAISYVAMVVAGIALARALATRCGDAAFLVLLPPAVALALGTYVHLAQMAAALPALALLIRYAPAPGPRRAAYAALFALAIPWGAVADDGAFDALLWPHAVAPRRVALPVADGAALADRTESDFMAGGGYGSNGATVLENIVIKLPTWAGLFALAGISATVLVPGRSVRMKRVSRGTA